MKKLNMWIMAMALVAAPLTACTGGGGSSTTDPDDGKTDAKPIDGKSDDDPLPPTPTKCSHDWDCKVGEVCRDVPGADGKLCQAAEAEEERVFGKIDLGFDENQDLIVAVYSVPTGDEAKLGSISYTLSIFEEEAEEDATSDAISDADADTDSDSEEEGGMAALQKKLASSNLSPEWQARLAFDTARSNRIGRTVKALRAGKQKWHMKKDGGTCDPKKCDGVCVKGACVGDDDYPKFNLWMQDAKTDLDAVLMYHENGVAIFMDADDYEEEDNDSYEIIKNQIGDVFAKIIMPRDLKFFGPGDKHEGPLDRDGNGYMTVVLSSKLCNSKLNVLGFFDDRDYMDSSMVGSAGKEYEGASGNEADILWVRSIGAVGDCESEASVEKILGTMAHEYQHLISYGRRVYAKNKTAAKELLWLDEGIAHLAEDLTGYGSGNYSVIAKYLDMFNDVSFSASYPSTGSTAEQHVAGRAAAYLFLRYIFESLGGATYSASDDESKAADIKDEGGIAFLQKLYNSDYAGLSNVAQASGKKIADIMADYVEELLFDGIEEGRGFATPVDDPITGFVRGIKLRGETFTDSDGVNHTFEGPALIDEYDVDTLISDGIEAMIEGEGAINYIVLSGDELMTIAGTADAAFDGHLAVFKADFL